MEKSLSSLHGTGKIIVFNGTSSSGKTSLAIELQQLAPDLQLLHLQLDTFRAMEPEGYWSDQYKEQAFIRLEALCRAIDGAAAGFARCGQNIIVDHVLTPQVCDYMLEDLVGYCVLLVKVKCNPEVLNLREAQRANRPLGLARSQSSSVHIACCYDFEIDTTSRATSDLARELAVWLRSEPVPKAYSRMQRNRKAA